jgi:hypothetical protein
LLTPIREAKERCKYKMPIQLALYIMKWSSTDELNSKIFWLPRREDRQKCIVPLFKCIPERIRREKVEPNEWDEMKN